MDIGEVKLPEYIAVHSVLVLSFYCISTKSASPKQKKFTVGLLTPTSTEVAVTVILVKVGYFLVLRLI